MTTTQLVPHLVALALLGLAAALCLREGYRTHTHPGHGQQRPHSRHIGTAHQDRDTIKEHDMTHRTDAEATIRSAASVLADLSGPTNTNVSIAITNHANAIATAAIAQAVLALADAITAARATEEPTR